MTQKHTPRPWLEETNYCGKEKTGWIVDSKGKNIVEYEGCGSHRASWPNLADKILALAAPDLLEFVEAFLAWDVDGVSTLAAQARAVRAKAKGE